MKKLLIIMIIIITTGSLAAQTPAPDQFSLHITPSIVRSDLTLAGADFDNSKTDIFQFNVQLVIPLTSTVSLSPFYESEKINYFINDAGSKAIIFGTHQRRYGMTLSVFFE